MKKTHSQGKNLVKFRVLSVVRANMTACLNVFNNANLYANLYSIYFLSSNWDCVVVSHNTERNLDTFSYYSPSIHIVFKFRRPSCKAASGHRVKVQYLKTALTCIVCPRVVNKKLLALLCVFA